MTREEENKQLKEINEEHRKLNGELREENKQLQQKVDKAIEITNQLLMNSADNRLIANKEENEYFDWLDKILIKQLEILGDSNE